MDIYDEVLADRKKLLEVAESNAKNKIVDAITPRIKELVENAILGKLTEDEHDGEDILLGVLDQGDEDAIDISNEISPPPVDPVSALPPVAGPSAISAMPGIPTPVAPGDAAISLPGPDGKVTLDVDAVTQSQGAMNLGTEFELNAESLKALNVLVGMKKPINLETFESRAAKMESVLKKIRSSRSPSIKDREQARQLKLECERIYSDIQETRDFLDESRVSKIETRLENVFKGIMERYSAAGHISAVVKEMIAINKQAGTLNSNLTESRHLTGADFKACVQMLKQVMGLHASVRKLHESLDADDTIDSVSVRQVGTNLATLYTEIRKMVTKKGKRINEADDLDLGAGVEDAMDMGGEEAEVDAEKVLVQLELPASLKDITAGDQVSVVDVSPAGGDEDDVSMDDELGAEEPEGLDDIGLDDLDGEEAGEEEVEDEMMDGDMYEAKLADDDIIEIDEAALFAEMKNMKKLREKKYAVRHGGHGPGPLDDFGGGKDEGEKFVDGQELNQGDDIGSEGYLEEGEEDLDEADDLEETDELDEMDELDEEDEVEMSETHQKAGTKNGQSKDRRLAEAVKTARAELAEQKLFNTKLVALNKVLQFPGLKRAQKEKIVEVLDKGRTVAEVQQLYGKIVEALKKDAKPIHESASRTAQGSGSRATTSAAASSDNEAHPLLEKWNKIAFGGTGNIQG